MMKKPKKHLGYGNARNATTYTVDGITDTLRGWSDRLGMTYHALYKRICLQGRSPEDAIRAGSKPINRRFITVNEKSHTIAEWGRKTGIDADTISERLIDGWSPEEAVGLKKHINRQAKFATYRGKTRRLCEWARELGISYEAFRMRLYLVKDGRLSRRAAFTKGNLPYWGHVRKVKHQNWYRGKRISIDEIGRRKNAGRTWVCTMFRLGYTATQIINNPSLAPLRDKAEISRRQAASQRRNKRLRELKAMGITV